MIDHHVGRYEVISEIGHGGMATIYLAKDPHLKRTVAIKFLPGQLLQDADIRARFYREAKIIASLEHAGIAPIYDFGEVDGQPYIVMRYIPGGSLQDRIEQGPLSLEEATRIIACLAPALDYAHRKGVIHRDLKPNNILFDQFEDPLLVDFGIAKLSEATQQLTEGYIIGTPAYMSPEQGRGDENIDGRSDIYSLGVVLFLMLTGMLPYESTTPTGYIIRHINDPIPLLIASRPDLPLDCQTVITRVLAKQKEERFSTAVELAQALDSICSCLNEEERKLLAMGQGTFIRRVNFNPPAGYGSAENPGAAPDPPVVVENPPFVENTFRAWSLTLQKKFGLKPNSPILNYLGLGIGGIVFIWAFFLIAAVWGQNLFGLVAVPTPTSSATPLPALTSTSTPLPAPTFTATISPSPTSTFAPRKSTVKQAADGLAGPGAGYMLIVNLHKDSLVTIIGRNNDGRWIYIISSTGHFMWIDVQALNLDIDPQTIPIISPIIIVPTLIPTATSVPTSTPIPPIPTNPYIYVIPTDTQKPPPPAPATSTPVPPIPGL